MQVNFLDLAQLADLLSDYPPLITIDHDGQLIHVLTHDGAGILAIVNPITGSAAIVYPSEAFDHEGGSIHDDARAALA